MEKQIKTNIEVSGVILTDATIKRLKDLQEHDNSGIDSVRDSLANAVCLISTQSDQFQDEESMRKFRFVIADLAYIRDYFLDFMKP